MTIRLDMRRAVRKARDVLGDSVDPVAGFFRRQLAPDGGFRGRDERSDLYYTVFGLEASLALDAEIPLANVAKYLDGFGTGAALDLVHLAALIRCRTNLVSAGDAAFDASTHQTLLSHLLDYRANDGGFHTSPGAPRGNVYGSFLALGAYQDLEVDCPDVEAVVASIHSLQLPDGGYTNEPTMTVGATAATAAALTVLQYLQRPAPSAAIEWLSARAHPLGGFAPTGLAAELQTPDLLSSATALHALSLVGADTAATRERHLDYLDTLWTAQGGFRGHWGDETVDCEYTYYGLLSLGHLAEG